MKCETALIIYSMIMAEKLRIQPSTLGDSNRRVAGETERGDRRTTSPEGSPGLQSEGREEILTITSSGGSAESIYSGVCLGQFVYNGEHKGAASYKQRHTTGTYSTRFLYRLGDSTWAVGPVIYVALAPRHPSPVITGSTVTLMVSGSLTPV